MDSALLFPVLFVFGSLVSFFLGSGILKVSFVGGSVSLLVLISVCLSVSGIWSVVADCVSEVGILCVWVCELDLFGFFGIWALVCNVFFLLAGKACLFPRDGEYSVCVVFNCNFKGVRDTFGVFWV